MLKNAFCVESFQQGVLWVREHENAAQSKTKAKPPRPQPSMKTGLRAPGPRPSKKGDDDADAEKCHTPSLSDRL